VRLIDVRTPEEYERLHADFAESVPLERLDPGKADTPLYVIGWTDTRSRQACERLRAAGHEDVVQVEGGTQAWEAAGLPVVRDEAPFSPVRAWALAAMLVLAIVLFGFHTHPLLAALVIVVFAIPLAAVFDELIHPYQQGRTGKHAGKAAMR
jgi:rhodanese-related sulfurtransferase